MSVNSFSCEIARCKYFFTLALISKHEAFKTNKNKCFFGLFIKHLLLFIKDLKAESTFL
jgi:hypothetical protein